MLSKLEFTVFVSLKHTTAQLNSQNKLPQKPCRVWDMNNLSSFKPTSPECVKSYLWQENTRVLKEESNLRRHML